MGRMHLKKQQENQPRFQRKRAFDDRSWANQSWKVSLRFWEVAAFKLGKTKPKTQKSLDSSQSDS